MSPIDIPTRMLGRGAQGAAGSTIIITLVVSRHHSVRVCFKSYSLSPHGVVAAAATKTHGLTHYCNGQILKINRYCLVHCFKYET